MFNLTDFFFWGGGLLFCFFEQCVHLHERGSSSFSLKNGALAILAQSNMLHFSDTWSVCEQSLGEAPLYNFYYYNPCAFVHETRNVKSSL